MDTSSRRNRSRQRLPHRSFPACCPNATVFQERRSHLRHLRPRLRRARSCRRWSFPLPSPGLASPRRQRQCRPRSRRQRGLTYSRRRRRRRRRLRQQQRRCPSALPDKAFCYGGALSRSAGQGLRDWHRWSGGATGAARRGSRNRNRMWCRRPYPHHLCRRHRPAPQPIRSKSVSPARACNSCRKW